MSHFIIVLNHSVFHLDWMWKSIYFKLDNTNILLKPAVSFEVGRGGGGGGGGGEGEGGGAFPVHAQPAILRSIW